MPKDASLVIVSPSRTERSSGTSRKRTGSLRNGASFSFGWPHVLTPRKQGEKGSARSACRSQINYQIEELTKDTVSLFDSLASKAEGGWGIGSVLLGEPVAFAEGVKAVKRFSIHPASHSSGLGARSLEYSRRSLNKRLVGGGLDIGQQKSRIHGAASVGAFFRAAAYP